MANNNISTLLSNSNVLFKKPLQYYTSKLQAKYFKILINNNIF